MREDDHLGPGGAHHSALALVPELNGSRAPPVAPPEWSAAAMSTVDMAVVVDVPSPATVDSRSRVLRASAPRKAKMSATSD